MSKATLQVIVIDPFKKEIRYEEVKNPKVTHNYGDFNKEIYSLMSTESIRVHIVEAAYLQADEAKHRDSILVDEEGLYKDPQEQKFFGVEGSFPQPLAGIGVVTGADDSGDTIEPSLDIDWFKQRVKFYNFADIQRMYAR
jgi:hypothetical protein